MSPILPFLMNILFWGLLPRHATGTVRCRAICISVSSATDTLPKHTTTPQDSLKGGGIHSTRFDLACLELVSMDQTLKLTPMTSFLFKNDSTNSM